MRKIFLFLLFVIYYVNTNGQIILSQDTNFCVPQPHNLYALSAVQSSMATDDLHDVVVPLGFNFDFYGGTYNSCVVSGNGYITFDTTVANTGSPWSINIAIPNPGQMPENAIMAPWQDINTGVVGSIFYGTSGIAPNRIFTVTWCEIAMFSCTQLLHTSQVVLHEGSNKIEMFIKNKPLCATWNGGAAVQGLVDVGSVNFDIVDDPILAQPRNFPLNWTANNEGWEFIPNGTTQYTINQINYVPIIAGVATWYDNLGNIIGTGSTITVNPTVSTTYYCDIQGSCIDSSITNLDSVTIDISGCFTIDVESDSADCTGTNGTITVTPSLNNTSPPWLIELLDLNGNIIQTANNVMTTYHIFSNVSVGTYIVTVTDPLGYSSSETIYVGQVNNPLSINSNVISNVNCFAGSDGIVTVTPSGGSLPYQYFLNGVSNNNASPLDSVFDNLNPGSYIISVVDNDNCLDIDTVYITQPNFPLQITATAKLMNCYGDLSGTATVTSIGGTPPYSYEWFDGSFNPIGIGDSISGLAGGSYFVKVTDANGCDTFSTLQVLQQQTPLVGNNQIFGVACKGDSTGMIVSQAIGSQAPYRYYWFDSFGDTLYTVNTDQFKFGRDTLYNLPTGTYDLHLYDAFGCTENYTITVGEPTDALSIDSVVLSNMVTCYGESDGAAQTFVSGGMTNYYFMWDNGELNSNAVNLTSGYHVVTLTDDWGCVVKDSVYVPENPEIETTILIDNEVSCYGLSDGSISASSIGGVPNYSYFWSNGHTDIGTSTTNSGLVYGSYYLTTQDIYGCEVFDSVLVSQPDPLFVEADEIDSISCYGYDDGLAYAYALGGTAPYTFYWDSLTGFVGDTNGALTPGIHTVYVVDSRGCQSSDTILTHEPPIFEVEILDSLTVLAYCIGVNSASLTSLANGGTPPYWYEWDDNPVTPQTNPTASNLLAGVYTITVMDSRGCLVSDTRDIDTITGTMMSTIEDPISYNGGYHVSCYGADDGMLYVIGGGTDHGPLTYQWYGPNGFSSTNDSIFDLQAGTYSVTVLDTNNCSVNNSFDITTPDDLQYTTTSVLREESCEGSCNGQLEINLVGGTSPYVGVSTEMSTGVQLTSTMIGDSILSDMCSGTWSVVLTDANGCSSSLFLGGVGIQTVGYNNQTISQIDTSTVLNVLCYGTSTGSLSVLNPSTNPNFSYNWENVNSPGISVGLGSTVNNLPAGIYVLESQYSDSLNFGLPYEGCTNRDTIEIVENLEVVVNALITNVDCFDQNTGIITVAPPNGNIVGGVGPYSLQWNPGGMLGSTVTSLTNGTYTLSVMDSEGCVKIDTFEVSQPDLLTINITENNATLSANVNGGVPGYTYRWKEFSNQSVTLQGGSTYVVLTPGSYYCEIEDMNGCITESDTITFSNSTSLDLKDLDIRIYPNPFVENTTVDFGRMMIEGSVNVLDILGNVVDVYELDHQRELVIERGTKSKGVYFVEITVNNKKIHHKITLQ